MLIEYLTGEYNSCSNVWIIRLAFCRVMSTSFCICSGNITNCLDLCTTLFFKLDHMSTQVPWPMVIDYFSSFTPWCDSVITNDCCQSTVSLDGSECAIGENTLLSTTADTSVTESSDVPMLDSGSSDNKNVSYSDFVVHVDNDGSVEYERMSSEGATATGSVGVSQSTILLEFDNRKTWQPSGVPWDCDFYLYQKAFPRT